MAELVERRNGFQVAGRHVGPVVPIGASFCCLRTLLKLDSGGKSCNRPLLACAKITLKHVVPPKAVHEFAFANLTVRFKPCLFTKS